MDCTIAGDHMIWFIGIALVIGSLAILGFALEVLNVFLSALSGEE